MNRVVHFDIQADDVERAIKFYKNAFGWEIKKWEGEGMPYWLIMTGKEQPGIDGGLMARPKEDKDKMSIFYSTIGVMDIDKAMADVKANGGEIIMDKMELKGVGWFASAKDTEGNRFSLMQADPNMKMM